MISACMWVVLIPATILVWPPTDACQIAMLWYLSSISFSSILHFLRKFLSTYFPCYLTFAAHMLWLVWHNSVVDNYFPLRDPLWPPSATQSVDSSLLQYTLHSDSLSHLSTTIVQYFSPIVSSTRHSIVNSSVYHCFFLSTQQTYAWQRECLRQLFFHTYAHSILWSICVAIRVSMTTLPRIIRKVLGLFINMSVAHVRYVALLLIPFPGIKPWHMSDTWHFFLFLGVSSLTRMKRGLFSWHKASHVWNVEYSPGIKP